LFAAGVSADYWRKTAVLAVHVQRSRRGALRLLAILVSGAIAVFAGQVKSAESPVQGEDFPQMMHVAVETVLDRLQYLMPAEVQGTSRFLEMV
jgi:hypothetical protein